MQVPLSGHGLLGDAATTAQLLNVPDAHIHPRYALEIDEAAVRLPEGRETLCVVPLKDHFGRVVGLLHAYGKQGVECRGVEREWVAMQEKIYAPAFTDDDAQFLQIIGDKIAAAMQLMQLHNKGQAEVVELQLSSLPFVSYGRRRDRPRGPTGLPRASRCRCACQ